MEEKKISRNVWKFPPDNCLQSGENVLLPSVHYRPVWRPLVPLCSWHLHKWGSGACISLCNGVSHLFPLRKMTCSPKALQAHWRLKLDSNLMTFALLLSEPRGHTYKTCICSKSMCKHFSSHHSTPCQKVKPLLRAQCWKTCWLPESLTLEPKFTDTFSTGTSHMRNLDLLLC